MVSDIIIIALVVLFIIIGWRRGIMRTLLNLAAVTAASMGARFASVWLSDWIYQSFVKQTVISNLETLITQNGAVYAIRNCFEAVPGWLKAPVAAIAALFGRDLGDISRSVSSSVTAQSQSLALTIEQPLGKVAAGALAIMLSFVLFTVFMVVLKLIMRPILRIFELPVLRAINRFFGSVIGAAEGIVVSWLAINLFCVIMTYTNPVVLDNQTIFGKIFQFMCLFM